MPPATTVIRNQKVRVPAFAVILSLVHSDHRTNANNYCFFSFEKQSVYVRPGFKRVAVSF
jgi:hypothetical protein